MKTHSISELWESSIEGEWHSALDHYWEIPSVKRNWELEHFINTLSVEWVKKLKAHEWYEFLRDKYFPWKYTAPNRLASTTKLLRRYEDQSRLEYLHSIKKQLFGVNVSQIGKGLEIAGSIDGLGPPGASGLLAVLFPEHFGCADQFVVRALCDTKSLPQRLHLIAMLRRAENLTEKDAMILIAIMRQKARRLNDLFGGDKWTPRKIDMILWSARNSDACVSNGNTRHFPE